MDSSLIEYDYTIGKILGEMELQNNGYIFAYEKEGKNPSISKEKPGFCRFYGDFLHKAKG